MLISLYLEAAEAAHASLTRFDQAAGDGDFGDNLRDGLRGAYSRIPFTSDLATEVGAAATYFLDEVGGTSGPLLGLLPRQLATGVAASPSDVDGGIVRGLTEGTAAIQRVGEAEVGDRTLVDCLAPTLSELRAADAGAIGVALLFWALALYRDPASRHQLPAPAEL